MTIRTFWTILLKMLGLYLVFDSAAVVLQMLNFIITPTFVAPGNIDFISMGIYLLGVALYILLLWLFLFKTTWLIDKLHLDKGFTEEKLELTLAHSSVLTIAVIVIGGLMLVDSLPQLCRETFNFFQSQNVFREEPETTYLIFHAVKTVLGYLLMTNSKRIVSFINKQESV